MKHLDDGQLRRLLDEPGEDGGAREHARTCPGCSERAAALAGTAEFVSSRMTADASPAHAAAAFSRVQSRLDAAPAFPSFYRPMAACAAAAAFVLALLFTPLGGYARSLLTIFEPQQFVPIDVTQADLRDLRLLPHADAIGELRVLRKPRRTSYADLADARKHVGFTVLRPTQLPAHFGTVHSFSAVAPGSAVFTFSAKKARAFELRSHKAPAPMPSALDGTSLLLNSGYVFDAHYEGSGPSKHAFFELVEMQAPRITSKGAPVETLENYILSLPDVSPQLAAQIRALRDIRTTVPVPVRSGKQSANPVTVQGVQGLAIGDNTGLGAGVLWQKNGIVYAVAGPLTMNEVLSIAGGLR